MAQWCTKDCVGRDREYGNRVTARNLFQLLMACSGLFGLVLHLGSHVSAGHYIAVVKAPLSVCRTHMGVAPGTSIPDPMR